MIYENDRAMLGDEAYIQPLVKIYLSNTEYPHHAGALGTVLEQILQSLLEIQILQALYEAIASEHSARMVAMRNATDAADELIGDLTLTYNKARQHAITMSLLDIAGAVAALE